MKYPSLNSILIPLLVTLVAVLAGSPAGADGVMGQVASKGIKLEGLQAPSGTTISSPALLETGGTAGLVYLSNGRSLAIAPQTAVSLETLGEGGVKVAVLSGTVAFRSLEGELLAVESKGSVVLNQEGEIGEGRPIAMNQDQVVAHLMELARRGENRVDVDTVESMLQTREGRLVLRSADGEAQQLACINRIRERKAQRASTAREDRWPWVSLQSELDAEFARQDMVIQGESSFVPGQGEGVVAHIREVEDAEWRNLVPVDEVSKIDPWKKVLIRSADGSEQEIRCIRTVIGPAGGDRDDRDDNPEPYFTITNNLEHDYEEGAEIVQGSPPGTGEGVVAKLADEADKGDSELRLDSLEKLDPLGEVLIRSADGSDQEVHCLVSVDKERREVELKQSLEHDFLAGVEILQGSDVRSALARGLAEDRLEGCDCCGVPAIWPPPIGVFGAGVLGALVLDELLEEEEPISPNLP